MPWHDANSSVFYVIRQPPMDSFPCGHVKTLVYQVKPDNQQLTARVGDAVAKVTHKMPQSIWTQVEYRQNICRATSGAQNGIYWRKWYSYSGRREKNPSVMMQMWCLYSEQISRYKCFFGDNYYPDTPCITVPSPEITKLCRPHRSKETAITLYAALRIWTWE